MIDTANINVEALKKVTKPNLRINTSNKSNALKTMQMKAPESKKGEQS